MAYQEFKKSESRYDLKPAALSKDGGFFPLSRRIFDLVSSLVLGRPDRGRSATLSVSSFSATNLLTILIDLFECTMNNCESEEIVEAANIAISNLLPTKSRSLYDIAYNRFKKWCAEKNVQVYSENVLLAYFSENAKNYKSSTLWAQYSMVKSCLIIYDNIDISKFPKLIAFFKRTGDGYQAKKIENIDKE
ncbi:hypothetical protein NQ317_019641 [Molorchus minor]|uniref:Uncharacterized protein n=1 Tax=Molorchus minor TaxID=1323400 RepID=A0ABQ9JLT2_9CUCU|nr:hypothetical protein NQ317_019641 [Molorchus minor]